MNEEGAQSSAQPYSRAFDNIVQDDDDVVGLLAYALYKRAIREDAQEGRQSSGYSRNPSKTVVETYRQAAERTLSEVIGSSLEAAKPELQVSAALSAVEAAKADIREHVTQRTGFLPALLTNIVAWAFTLLLTVLILLALNLPEPARMLSDAATKALDEPSPQNSN